MEKRDMWVPHKELKKKTKEDEKATKKHTAGRMKIDMEKKNIFFLILIFFLRFTETCPSEFVGINTKSGLCDEGYA